MATFLLLLALAWYQTYWFYELCLPSALLAVAALQLLRLRRVRAQARELTLLVDERTQELQQEIAARKQAEAALQESQAMFQNLFDSAPDAILVVNREQRIERANTQAAALFGYGENELPGQPIGILLPERFTERHEIQVGGYISKPNLRRMGTGPELYGWRKDGREFPVEVTLGSLETRQGSVVLSIFRDVTERRQAEEALRNSAALYHSLVEGLPLNVFF